MKKKVKTVATIIVLLMVAIWIIDKISFRQTIEQDISANLYQDGVVLSETSISMQGEKTNYLFRRNESFAGYFAIPAVDQSVDRDMQIAIQWSGEHGENARHIRFFKAGTIYSADRLGVVPYMLINDRMTKFALMLTDGTIIATSKDLEELYRKHITWQEDTKTTTIIDANRIPEIE